MNTTRLAALVVWLGMGAAAQAEPARYLVVERDASGVLRLVTDQRVDVAGFASGPDKVALAPDALEWVVRDQAGAVVARGVVEATRVLRGEFPAADGSLVGHRIVRDTQTYVVRVPEVGGGRVELATSEGDASLAVDFAAGPNMAALPAARVESTVTKNLGATGDPANRVDVVIVGDGYLASEQSAFQADAANLAAEFLALEPYASYRGFINMTTLFVASNQSGADHPEPVCEDGTPDPLAPLFVDTAFDATFCSFGIHRLLTVDESKVVAAAAVLPDWDHLLVVVNDEVYGGSGGLLAVISTNEAVVDLALHEYGHSFTQLADEYDGSSAPGCTDLGGGSCEANVTDATSIGEIKWNEWIAGSTPIPTPATNSWIDVVGLFEGARYTTTGLYRPWHTCLMRALGSNSGIEFCPVCAEAYALRLFNGGWGVPDFGLSWIEPGSRSPSEDVSTTVGATTVFSVDVVRADGSLPAIQWFIDNTPVSGANGTSFSYHPAGVGIDEVSVEVLDSGNTIHPVNRLGADGTSWTVTVEGPGVCEADGNTLCLDQNRFQVEVDYRVGGGALQSALVAPDRTDDSGIFYFSNPNNLEFLVKMVNGCSLNNRFWVYFAATTDLEFTMRVVDTAAGVTRTYNNAAGHPADAVTDSNAFATCAAVPPPRLPAPPARAPQRDVEAASASAAAAKGSCTPGSETMCLGSGRYAVTVDWRGDGGTLAPARVANAGTADSGIFYFNNPDNWEFLVKVLDACAINNRVWVYSAATTNVQFTLTVTDTQTGTDAVYNNALGHPANAITDINALAVCGGV